MIIRRFAAPIVIRGMVADALLTQKESIDKESGGRLYTLELTEIVSEENFRGDVRLDPGAPVGNERLTHEDYLPAGISKLQQKHKKIKSFLKNFREMSRGKREDAPVIFLKIEEAGADGADNTDDYGSIRMGTEDNGLRFSLSDYSDEDYRDIVALLRPYVGQAVEKDAEDYQRYLKKMGVDVPADDVETCSALSSDLIPA